MSAVTLKGRLGFAEVGNLLGQLDAMAASGEVDLSGVTHIDSAGLSLLLELTRRARRSGKTVSLANAPAQLRDLARFFKLDTALQL